MLWRATCEKKEGNLKNYEKELQLNSVLHCVVRHVKMCVGLAECEYLREGLAVRQHAHMSQTCDDVTAGWVR